MKHLVILGAGTGGTMMAHRLRRELPEREWRITIVDRDELHLYQPGLLLLPFGVYRPKDLFRPRRATLPPGVELRLEPIAELDPEQRLVRFPGGDTLTWDVLVVATGARLLPEETEGMTGRGWRESIFDFYTIDGAIALGEALERFQGGRVVVHFVDTPIKCPVAPLEMAFLLDAHFTRRGIRNHVELVFATPLDGAFTKPRASALLSGMLDARGIAVEPSFAVASVNGADGEMKGYDGRTIPFDLLVTVPLHGGSELIQHAGMGDAAGFLPTDKHTLQSKRWEHVFALGDATDLPTSKAGSVAHFQAEVLTDNIARWVRGRPLAPAFDGHANCFIETGHDKALLIDFNYDTEPLPGRYPLPGVGPFKLLEESRVNHLGKLAFKWLYWNALLPGKELPIESSMSMAGKWSQP